MPTLSKDEELIGPTWARWRLLDGHAHRTARTMPTASIFIKGFVLLKSFVCLVLALTFT